MLDATHTTFSVTGRFRDPRTDDDLITAVSDWPDRDIDTFDISNNQLFNKHVTCLAIIMLILAAHKLKHISFSYNFLANIDERHIAKIFGNLPSALESLDMSNNMMLSLPEDQLKEIFSLLPNNLIEINISDDTSFKYIHDTSSKRSLQALITAVACSNIWKVNIGKQEAWAEYSGLLPELLAVLAQNRLRYLRKPEAVQQTEQYLLHMSLLKLMAEPYSKQSIEFWRYSHNDILAAYQKLQREMLGFDVPVNLDLMETLYGKIASPLSIARHTLFRNTNMNEAKQQLEARGTSNPAGASKPTLEVIEAMQRIQTPSLNLTNAS